MGDRLPHVPSPLDWLAIYKLLFQVARETRMHALQYKILHMILPCRRYLKAICHTTEDTCLFCPARDTIPHFLYECPDTRLLWSKIAGWLIRAGGPNISLVPSREIILGVLPKSRASTMINLIILFTKCFIQRQRLFHNGTLSLTEWLACCWI